MKRYTRNGRIKVRRLQRALKQEETYRFYRLYDKLWCKDIRWEAWRQVKTNKGAPGIDGVAIETIVMQGEEGEMLTRMQKQLREKRYPFSPVRQVEIPQPKGGTRPLGISTVEGRIVQTAMKRVIEPIFEAGFHDCSSGYRPKRSAKEASIAIREDLYNRSWGVVEIDFKFYFTRIPMRNYLN